MELSEWWARKRRSPHTTIWNGGGAPIDLGVAGGTRSQGLAINSTGQVVGLSGAATYQATLWTGTAVNLGTLGGPFSIATSINNLGQIVGVSQIVGGSNRAFSYSNGAMTEIPSLAGANSSQAFDINNQGQIVGRNDLTSGNVQATIWNAGVPSALQNPFLNGTFSVAQGLNDLGQAVGVIAPYSSDFSVYHAARWTNGAALDLGLGAAEDINNIGQIVGVYSLPTGDARAKFWDIDGQGRDLTSLLDASGAGWTLYQATGINDAGQIVGAGVNASGQYRGFLLTPVSDVHGVPSPTLGAGLPGLLMAVLGFIGWLCHRRAIVA